MPLALSIIAVLCLIIAIRGNYSDAGNLFNATFFGTNGGFLKWFGSILAIALIFRIMGAPRAGQLFIGLLILVYFMENQGVLQTIEQAVTSGPSLASASGSASNSSSTSSSATSTGSK